MARLSADRVLMVTVTTGTGTYTLEADPKSGHDHLDDVSGSDGSTFRVCVTDYVDYEIIDGVYTASGRTFTRASVVRSTNSNAAVSWGSGNKDVFVVNSANSIIDIFGTNAFAADQSMGTHKLTNVGAGTSLTDTINLGQLYEAGPRKWAHYYCDSNKTIASTNAGTTFDGVVSSAGQTVILGGQSDLTENGVYNINASGGLTRRADFAVGMDPRGAMFNVIAGSNYNDTVWTITSNGSSIGTSNITYNLVGFSNAVAGNGLVRSGNALNVVGTSNRIDVSADAVNISNDYVGQTSITTLGTVTTGTWNATTIAVAKGGTGTTDGSITGSASLVFASTGSSSTITLTPGSSTGYVSMNGTTQFKKTVHPNNAATDGSTVTFDCSLGNVHSVTLGGNRTLALSNVSTDQYLHIKLKQDGTGSRTVTWFSTITWVDGTPTLATVANKTDEFIIRCTGSGTYVGYKITPDGGY